MRKITIVGAGQFGLHLGIALLRHGYEVRIVTNRTGEEVRNGRVLSSQILFAPVQAMEHALGLDQWADAGGRATASTFAISAGMPEPVISWLYPQPAPGGQSVDQRIKMPVWMEMFTAAGGELQIMDVGLADLDGLAATSDLLIVAAGKAEIANLFERDAERSELDKPHRHLSMVYVSGMKPHPSGHTPSSYVQAPGIGEYVTFPCVSVNGPCDILMFESVFDGPMHAIMRDAKTPEEHIAASQAAIALIAPWEVERVADVTPADPLGHLSGAVTPTVRKPFALLPSGRAVMGGGDVAILNDPITGQGSNNASRHADVVLRAILAHGAAPFDTDFMVSAFEDHWDNARWVCKFTNFILQPADPLPALMFAMNTQPDLRREFLKGFVDASTLADWLYEPTAATAKIAEFA